MADVFGPFDGLPWAEAQWYRFARTWAEDGILAAGDLALTTSGLSATIGTGRAWVGGAGFERTGTPAANTVAPNTHATQFRRDRIVLRRSLGTRTVAPVVLQGSPAASPVAPAISQNEAGDWDLPLWSFLVPPASGTTLSGLVDERELVTVERLSRLHVGEDDDLLIVIDSFHQIYARNDGAPARISFPFGITVPTPVLANEPASKGYVDNDASRHWITLFDGPVSYTHTLPTSFADLPNLNFNISVPAGRQLDVEVTLPSIEMSTGGLVGVRLLIDNVEVDAATLQSSALMTGSAELTGDLAPSGAARTINVRAQGYKVGGGSYVVGGSSQSGPRFRYRRL